MEMGRFRLEWPAVSKRRNAVLPKRSLGLYRVLLVEQWVWQKSFKRKGTGISSFRGDGEGFFTFRAGTVVSLAVLRQRSATIACVQNTFKLIRDN